MQTTLGAIDADSEEDVALAAMWGGSVVLKPLWGREGVALDVSALDVIRRACGRRGRPYGTCDPRIALGGG